MEGGTVSVEPVEEAQVLNLPQVLTSPPPKKKERERERKETGGGEMLEEAFNMLTASAAHQEKMDITVSEI
jgi:hypothetical protein